jgi:hypothetical protein
MIFLWLKVKGFDFTGRSKSLKGGLYMNIERIPFIHCLAWGSARYFTKLGEKELSVMHDQQSQ